MSPIETGLYNTALICEEPLFLSDNLRENIEMYVDGESQPAIEWAKRLTVEFFHDFDIKKEASKYSTGERIVIFSLFAVAIWKTSGDGGLSNRAILFAKMKHYLSVHWANKLADVMASHNICHDLSA